MCEDPPYDRRRFLGITAMTIAAAHLGTRDVAHAQSRTTPPAALPPMKPGTQAAVDNQRLKSEWTVYVLVALLLFLVVESVWAWVCGKAW